MLDCIEHLLNVLTVGTFEERAETVKDLLTDSKTQELEKINKIEPSAVRKGRYMNKELRTELTHQKTQES